MEDFLKRLFEHPMGNQLYSYLQGANRIPKVEEKYLREGLNGEYSPFSNTITLHRGFMPSTAAHEMGHAADAALTAQYMDRDPGNKRASIGTPLGMSPMFGGKTQFTDAFDKIGWGTRRALSSLFNKKWTEENHRYRANESELAGHAIGNVGPASYDSWDSPQHLNPTLATEMSILLDLAKRGDKQKSLLEYLFQK